MRVLAIGAFERDNFGDILFLDILKKYLPKGSVIPASVIYSDMTSLAGDLVLPYEALLDKYQWDVVWVVGGEVGGCDVDMALDMSLEDELANIALKNIKYKKFIKIFFGAPLENDIPAYIPDLSRYLRNSSKQLIINSVGLSGSNAKSNKLNMNTIKALASASSISVRDKKSLDYCNNNNISAILAPDIVHTAPLHYPNIKLNKSDSNYILFQSNSFALDEGSIKDIAESLIESVEMIPDGSIRFMSAGTARHHDSEEAYDLIMLECNQLNPNIKTSIISDRDPVKLVECIANASVFVGTSLHGRIISQSYNVPRVSLVNSKVTEYVQFWDPDFPFNVKPSDLTSMIRKALLRGSNMHKYPTSSLSEQADKNIKEIIKKLDTSSTDSAPLDLRDYIKKSQASQKLGIKACLHELNINEATVNRLTEDKAGLVKENEVLSKQLSSIYKSKGWKILERFYKINHTLRRILFNQ